jgi:hypothetical protein
MTIQYIHEIMKRIYIVIITQIINKFTINFLSYEKPLK